MTQHELVMEYVKAYGEINPAKVSGHVFMGIMFGSETPKRCRELRASGKLRSEGEGKFVKFFLPKQSTIQSGKTISIWEQAALV